MSKLFLNVVELNSIGFAGFFVVNDVVLAFN